MNKLIIIPVLLFLYSCQGVTADKPLKENQFIVKSFWSKDNYTNLYELETGNATLFIKLENKFNLNDTLILVKK